jgi:hypothetical protein
MDGRLVAIKDNICTRDLPTTCASRILDKFTSPYNATVVDALEDAGAIVAGKTNLDEFGMGWVWVDVTRRVRLIRTPGRTLPIRTSDMSAMLERKGKALSPLAVAPGEVLFLLQLDNAMRWLLVCPAKAHC